MAISALVVVPAAVLAPGGPARRRLISAAAALAVLAVASLPWLIPSALRPVYADPAGIAAFAARADTPFGSSGSLLMLGGVWTPRPSRPVTGEPGRRSGWRWYSPPPPVMWPSACDGTAGPG